MAAAFKEVRKLQGERVRMQFDDGREIVAVLLCATKDIDGSKHLIYDKVEGGSPIQTGLGGTNCYYADAKTLVKIEPADAKNHPTGPRGRDHVTMRSQFEQTLAKTMRPSA